MLVTASESAPWGQALLTQNHVLFADEPAEVNGRDTGPTPTELVLLALGGCTAITVRMYAARKGWPIDRLEVRLRYDDPTGAEPKPARRRIERKIEIDGPLDVEQRARLFDIAEKCPVHKLLSAGADIRSELLPSG